MKSTFVKSLILATLMPLASTNLTVAGEVDDVIARHIKAKGGREKWNAISSIKMTGSFTAFSEIDSFTLQKKRDRKYRLDHSHNGHPVIIGNDGEQPWWDNEFMQPGARPLDNVTLAQQTREFDFATALFDVESAKHEVKLIGATDYEGEAAIAIELTRTDGSSETWYLNPETHLELARVSPGSDFGQPMEQRTIFDEFRTVSGVQIPTYVETQWYTRDRVMEVETVEVNLELDDSIFLMPPPTGMGPLQPLIGEWAVKLESKNRPKAEFRESELVSSIEKRIRGGLLEETFTNSGGDEVVRSFTYDQFRKKYRMTEIDGSSTYLDIQEGTISEDGHLVVDNIATGTPLEANGETIHVRTSLLDIGEHGFRLEQEASTDAGDNWWLANRATYTRKVGSAKN